MARLLYCLALYFAVPLVWLRLLWRCRQQPEYLRHLGERWGYYPAPLPTLPPSPLLWVHAVSVGETRAAEPLVRALQQRYPRHTLLLTGMTPTGRAAAREVYGDRVVQAYLPYDYPGAVKRFLRHFKPQLGILMETEIWPNLLAACQRQAVPVVLANARLSEGSAHAYRRFAALGRPAFASLAGAAAQTSAEAERLLDLGVQRVSVSGNLKFDVQLPDDKLALGRHWRTLLGERLVCLAASTREGEEALIVDAWENAAPGEALLLVVPRHPQRFATVAQLLAQRGLNVRCRSQGLPTPDTRVWLGDSMGEMVAYYTLADLAFIGGSLLPLGGQNLIEAAACACPILIGPHTFNFAQATEDAIACGAARRVNTVDTLASAMRELLADARQRQDMRRAALDYASAHRGATVHVLEFIEETAFDRTVATADKT